MIEILQHPTEKKIKMSAIEVVLRYRLSKFYDKNRYEQELELGSKDNVPSLRMFVASADGLSASTTDDDFHKISDMVNKMKDRKIAVFAPDWSKHPMSDGIRPVIVVEHDPGYYLTSMDWPSDKDDRTTLVIKINDKLGLSPSDMNELYIKNELYTATLNGKNNIPNNDVNSGTEDSDVVGPEAASPT